MKQLVTCRLCLDRDAINCTSLDSGASFPNLCMVNPNPGPPPNHPGGLPNRCSSFLPAGIQGKKKKGKESLTGSTQRRRRRTMGGGGGVQQNCLHWSEPSQGDFSVKRNTARTHQHKLTFHHSVRTGAPQVAVSTGTLAVKR